MGRLPYKIDVTANKGSLNDVPMGFNFIVVLNVFTYGFQEVSGLSMKRPMGSHEEGGVNDHVISVGQPSTDLRELTFRRGMLIKKNKIITDTARMSAAHLSSNTARKSSLLAISALDETISLEQGPSVGFLQIFDRKFKSEVATFSFFSLGMSEWRLNDLDSQSNNLLIEEFTVVHTGLKRIVDNPTPTFISGFISSDTYNSESYQTSSDYIDNSQMIQNDAKIREEFLKQSKSNAEKSTFN
ncbi:MAG: phage tail protein, partial [Oscillospiraceae bacterium]|nr:phage tail protein [Oscillospiraceae bacterium]